MSPSRPTALADFVQHRLTPAQFLDGLGVAWHADESGLSFEARNLPTLKETISVQPEDVASTLGRACAGELDRPELRLWATIILLTDYFSIGDTQTAEAREAAVEALHWLASSDEDSTSFLREAQYWQGRLTS